MSVTAPALHAAKLEGLWAVLRCPGPFTTLKGNLNQSEWMMLSY